MPDKTWIVAPPRPEAETLARETGLPLPLAQVLGNRGVSDPDEVRRFLHGTTSDLRDPFLLSGMSEAVGRINRAIESGEKILVFGDYDVDGVLSVVMLLKALGDLGGKAEYFIPARLKDGYGLKGDHADVVRDRGAGLVISVDCGIRAQDFALRARDLGVDVIITDHHLPGSQLPPATAILNPVLPDSGYPEKNLAGVGVVFKLLQGLLAGRSRESGLEHYLKLVALGTVADIAELRGENRIFVRQGLDGLARPANAGLKSLIEVCGLKGRPVSEGDVAFRLGPRLNAAGRMESADQAVRLFQTESADEARAIARHLDELNGLRQKTEEIVNQQALDKIRDRGLDRDYKILVLGSEGWHRGIVGIVASRLKEAFHRPVILFSYQDGLAFGSGRSIREFSLIECLEACRGYFLNYGGHRLAVGCSLPREKMKDFRAAVNAHAESRLSEDDLRPKLRIDAPLDPAGIDERFLGFYSQFHPFGVGNPTPLFIAEGVRAVGPARKLQDRHVKFVLDCGRRSIDAIGWDRAHWAGSVSPGDRLSLVYSLQFSTYLGKTRPYLCLEDIRT
jgi:single-stranded-DNA-specific exonuclease